MGVIVALRRAAYRLGVLRVHRVPVPVIVVGNLIVGGAGKTPLVLWLVQALKRRGYRPGIVSRGYGGSAVEPCGVAPGADPARFGDEPVLLAERSGAPVWIGVDRVAAARALLAAHPDRDVLILDDGLQHYALGRDFEIAVEDARGQGNGLLLPAGPMREPASRAVDARVMNGVMAPAGAYRMQLVPAKIYLLHDPAQPIELAALFGKRLHAAAALGYPERFFATLRGMGLAPVPHAFPDHHAYMRADLDFPDCDLVLVTEKDAVKCRGLGRSDIAVVCVDAEVDPALADRVVERLRGLETP